MTGTADKATDVVGAANRVLYNSATDDTTTSNNLQFDGTTLTGLGLEIKVYDNKSVKFGTDNDMTIFHDNTNGGINCGTGDLIINAGGNNGDRVIVQTGTTHIAKFEKHASTGLGGFEFLYNGSTRIQSQSWGTEIKNGELRVTGNDIIAYAASDINLKKDISPIQNALDMINRLSGNTFTWNSKSNYKGTDDIGILAQEVEELGLPGITQTRDNGVKAVRYDRLIPVLIEAVKELTAKVKSLESNK